MKKTLDMLAIFPEIVQISDPSIRERIIEVWERLWQQSKFVDINALPVNPKLAYPHVRHNQAVVQMALKVAEVLEHCHGVHVNRDVLIAAAVLQDASKLVEYQPTSDGVTTSELGSRFQHGFYAAHVALKVGLPDEVAQAILTHTYEAPQFPTTLTSKILFYVDQIDMAALGGDRWKKKGVVYR